MYIDSPLREYLNDLAAKNPAPGGGSAAALTAATGTSLMLMVARYTIGNPKYSEAETKIAEVVVAVEKADAELRALIDEDVSVFKKLSAGLKKSSATSEKKLEELYKRAAGVPFRICEICAQCIRSCRTLAESGNKALATDTAIAAILFDAAFFSAKFNVYVNLKNLKDTDHIARLHGVLLPLEEEIPRMKEDVVEICEDAISA